MLTWLAAFKWIGYIIDFSMLMFQPYAKNNLTISWY